MNKWNILKTQEHYLRIVESTAMIPSLTTLNRSRFIKSLYYLNTSQSIELHDFKIWQKHFNLNRWYLWV